MDLSACISNAPQPAIQVTSIVPPESGWPIMAHCSICQKTVILLSPWAIKPEHGDYWRLNEMCLDEAFHVEHNMPPLGGK